MNTVAHTVYLSVDLGMPNADVYAWLDEFVEDSVAPFYVPRINEAINGRAYRAQIFCGAHYWTFNEPSRDKLELMVQDSFAKSSGPSPSRPRRHEGDGHGAADEGPHPRRRG